MVTMGIRSYTYFKASYQLAKGERKKNYRGVFYPAISIEDPVSFTGEYETAKEACQVMNALATYTLLLHDSSLMADYSNMGSIQQWIDDEWVDVDEDDLDI